MIAAMVVVVFSACKNHQVESIDRLNEQAYAFHYRNLDSVQHYAKQALRLSDSCRADGAEAMNHLAFVCIAKMQYEQAGALLADVYGRTNNQVELLVADVQMMRLCQRQSRNKDFYNYRESAERRLQRIIDEAEKLSPHQEKRLVYAQSEMSIVASAYLYYIGLMQESVEALKRIDPDGDIRHDMAQQLAYWYNIGSGGMLTNGTSEEIAREEFENLVRCYMMSVEYDYPYWEAQALQGMSEHLQKADRRNMLIRNNGPAIKYINVDRMPDSLLAGNLAQRALNILTVYGDVYQTAGANRTLAECFWHIGDYQSALACLQRALSSNQAIYRAPDLVASICEQLSLTYSAVDDKLNSDRNRNIYLDLQEQTRQDRQLEARAGQLANSSKQLNLMLIAVLVMIVMVVTLLFVFHFLRRRHDARFSLGTLLEPLKQWRRRNEEQMQAKAQEYADIEEQTAMMTQYIRQNKRKNIEQRAKIQLVSQVLPLIDRMKSEVKRLQRTGGTDAQSTQRYQYIAELADTINDYNNVLTRWIQMRRGEVALQIESFALQPLFDIIRRGSMNYKKKGIRLEVLPTTSVVKADRTLTLFMINTIADNARRYTPEGGAVCISADEHNEYVEVSIRDNGCGMSREQLAHVFDKTYTGGHGFGLKNCKGIIEKYKKISRIFSICTIRMESEEGKGTHVFFRLPKGMMRSLVALVALVLSSVGAPLWAARSGDMQPQSTAVVKLSHQAGLKRDTASRASHYADSAYFSNIKGSYHETLRYADSCHRYLSPADTAILLDISNETAVAALALHQWDLYEKNNKIYTRLFRKASADKSLPEYVRTMQKDETNKNVAIVLLVLLLGIIFPAYYFLYFRYRLDYKLCIDRIRSMNDLLLGSLPDEEKLKGIDRLNDFHKFNISSSEQEKLQIIVEQIRAALQASVNMASVQDLSVELAEDRLRKLEMDNYRLHVSNSILDNCLSTLKHETMYYPSRIRRMVNEEATHLDDLDEMVSYYRELYQMLTLQAVRQIPPPVLDREMTDYLIRTLKTINGGMEPDMTISFERKAYVIVRAVMTQYAISKEECRRLFTPYTKNLKFLICRQITREMGEMTNLRACGVTADVNAAGQACITITMPEAYLKDEEWKRQEPVNNKE